MWAEDGVLCTAVNEHVIYTVLWTADDGYYDRQGRSNDVQISNKMIVLIDEVKVVCGAVMLGIAVDERQSSTVLEKNSERALRRVKNGQSPTMCGDENAEKWIAGACVEEVGKDTAENERKPFTIMSTACKLGVDKIEDGQ